MDSNGKIKETLIKENIALKNRIKELESLNSTFIQELRQKDIKFNTLFDCVHDAIFLADLESGKIINVNSAASKLLLREKEHIIGNHYLHLHSNQNEEDSARTFGDYMAQITNKDKMQLMEKLILRSDGSETLVEITAQMINLNGRIMIIGILHNISERRKMEEEIQESSLLLDEIFKNAINEVKGMADKKSHHK